MSDRSEADVQGVQERAPERRFFGLSQNVFVLGFVSLLTDFSSEVTIKILPLYLSNALGVQPSIIGFIEGMAETTATILKWVFGWLSDRMKKRKWLAFTGYAISNVTKPFLYFVASWPSAAFLRFTDARARVCARRRAMRCWPTRPRRRNWDVRLATVVPWIRWGRSSACWPPQAP